MIMKKHISPEVEKISGPVAVNLPALSYARADMQLVIKLQ
jgi:hypothetical protein